ncbi:MAG: PfkB family carbohydrate kinase [bacterium]
MKYDFITVGGATEDISLYTSEGILIDNKKDILRQKLFAFEYGAKLKVDKSFSTFGGGAANAAVSLARLGYSPAALVAIGEDGRGESIIKNFKKNKVAVNLIEKIKEKETGFSCLIVGQGNEHVVFSNRAANSFLCIGKKESTELKKAKWIYMTSLSGNWEEILRKVFAVKGPRVSWNPGHIQLHLGYPALQKYLKKTEMLTVNKDEATELVLSHPDYKNKGDKFLNNSKNLLEIIKSWGPKIVVITNGKYGADAYDGQKFYHQKILKEKRRINTTGVGDAFGSTFTAGLELFKGDIQKAMELGVRNTASVVAHMGAQTGLLTKKQIFK